jgi:riboflavin synthase
MFTGLIEEIGSVKKLKDSILQIECRTIQNDLHLGDSVAVNGVCLTIERYDARTIEAQVMPVTLKTTNLGTLKMGDLVNLERAMRLGDRIGGHLVAGHVDATATITRVQRAEDAQLVTIIIPTQLSSFVIPKGSIAIDGISLTIAYLDHQEVTVSLVGHTKTHATLAGKKKGELVNIEIDQMGKYVHRILTTMENKEAKPAKNTVDITFLQRHGFTS